MLGGILEAYGYGLLERDTGSQLEGIQTRSRRLFTPGFRLYRVPRPGQFDHELEVVGQVGVARNTAVVTDVTDLPVTAYFVHAEAGYTFETAWTHWISLHDDHASGDSANPNSYTRFDTPYGARRFDYGPTGLYGAVQRANPISPGVRFEVASDPDWDAFIDYRSLWLENPRDSFAATGVRDRAGLSGTFAGRQIEGRVRTWLVPRSIAASPASSRAMPCATRRVSPIPTIRSTTT
ncbi:alginate export family protein [Methylobacterium sp. B4]|uniref:alginate export family protein n=1 Tax=Methylobacterium sp. B4 TaxID=1938755 RepID=UPI000D81A583|nr:alginate export family protein [Methylobacterium sp. B4]PXW65913.1 alginate export protein [Methylobacterium sp. B4]